MTISSDLTLSGTPKDPGRYLVSVSIEDQQGRSAVSNTLPFRIYSGEETLVDQMKKENFYMKLVWISLTIIFYKRSVSICINDKL